MVAAKARPTQKLLQKGQGDSRADQADATTRPHAGAKSCRQRKRTSFAPLKFFQRFPIACLSSLAMSLCSVFRMSFAAAWFPELIAMTYILHPPYTHRHPAVRPATRNR